jgi:hypothetical protein
MCIGKIKKEKTMKTHLLYLIIIASVLYSCGGNGISEEISKTAAGTGAVFDNENIEENQFERTAFDHERQLWMSQGYENYAFYQLCMLHPMALNLPINI